MQSTVYNYADDNTISFIHKDLTIIKETLTKDARSAINWFKENMMKANPEKFQIMFLGKNITSENESINIGEITLKGSKHINILGIDIDEKLKFDVCVKSICDKMSKQINALLRIKNDIDLKSRRSIYNSYIASNLNYCSIIWMFTSRSNLKKLDKLNERALRMIYADDKNSYLELLKRNKTLDIYKMCINSLCVEMYRIRNKLAPNYICDLFTLSQNQAYDFRDDNNFSLPKFNTKTFGYRCMSYIGVKVWTNLDVNIKKINCLKKAKDRIKIWIEKHENTENFINAYF